ncbi:MAG: sigma 54-interacting transcriptional regulator [Candidatus Sumerlaeaceae bacterium]|nr:sigma 54-interacting transcriptional regulator [Candidatus Sumerlaeaceae bacterium]
MSPNAGEKFDEDQALQLLLYGTMGETGDAFLRALVKGAAEVFDTDAAWVTEYLPERQTLRSLAFWHKGRFIDNYEYNTAGTPCEPPLRKGETTYFGDKLRQIFPEDRDLDPFGAESYLGVPLRDPGGDVIGHLAVLDSRPMPHNPRMVAVFELFALRASAELQRMRSEMRERQLAEEADLLRDAVHELPDPGSIIGDSQAVRQLREAIARVAPTDATVLVLGETGTGKELVARAIHRASRRARGPLVKVNCAAVPANLIESEFFGHERGAFTGAVARREGRFALADTGTIFLDEIGEMPLDLQSKLLRVLQEGEYELVGSAKTRRVDVRVVAATNRDLAAMVRDGQFREDLFYRLNVFPLQTPPLRERGEDIIALATLFAARFAAKLGNLVHPLTEEDKTLLCSHDWPGNIRELQNVIERALILGGRGKLNLPAAMPQSAAAVQLNGNAAESHILTDAALRALERENIERALAACNGRIAGETGAAALLGVPPSTFTSRMKALGVKRG